MEAIAIRLEALAGRLEAIAIRVAIALGVEAIAIRCCLTYLTSQSTCLKCNPPSFRDRQEGLLGPKHLYRSFAGALKAVHVRPMILAEVEDPCNPQRTRHFTLTLDLENQRLTATSCRDDLQDMEAIEARLSRVGITSLQELQIAVRGKTLAEPDSKCATKPA